MDLGTGLIDHFDLLLGELWEGLNCEVLLDPRFLRGSPVLPVSHCISNCWRLNADVRDHDDALVAEPQLQHLCFSDSGAMPVFSVQIEW